MGFREIFINIENSHKTVNQRFLLFTFHIKSRLSRIQLCKVMSVFSMKMASRSVEELPCKRYESSPTKYSWKNVVTGSRVWHSSGRAGGTPARCKRGARGARRALARRM